MSRGWRRVGEWKDGESEDGVRVGRSEVDKSREMYNYAVLVLHALMRSKKVKQLP